jgi:hypothetical protein
MRRANSVILFVIMVIVSSMTISKQVLAVEPAWIDVSSIAAIPENPVIGEVFLCQIVTGYSNSDKLACGLVSPGAPDNTRAIDICMKSDDIGTGYQGYSNGTRTYKCTTNAHPNNTVTPGEFDLVAVSFDCDGNCSTIVKRHRIRILDRSQAPSATPVPPTPTQYIAPTSMPTTPLVEPTAEVVIVQDTPLPTEVPQYLYVTPIENSIDTPLVVQRPYSVPVYPAKVNLGGSWQNISVFRPDVVNKAVDLTATFLANTFRPFTQRSDIKVWESTKLVISSLYLNFINEAGL